MGPPDSISPAPAVPPIHDWDALAAQATAHLQRLIRFNTTNPPGNEMPAAQYLCETLDAYGIEHQCIESAPGRAMVYGRIPGDGGGSAQPIMLLAHSDVVTVEPEHWTTDPFGGEIREGYVYGRGAIDDKGMLAVNLTAVCALAQAWRTAGVTPVRDVVFLATCDEETGGALGMQWLVEHRPDLLRAEYAINEGGRVRIAPDGSRTLLLQTAEKVSHIVTITAQGHAGHAGVPRADNAIVRIGRALARISDYVSDPRHGVSPTILRGGEKSNVIPGEASVSCNIRTRPGESVDDVVAELARLINDAGVQLKIVERGEEAPASPEHSELYTALAECARAIDPELVVQPYLSNGITDSARLRRLGVKAYGILPFPLTAEDEGRMHGHDERVPLRGIHFGTRLITQTVERMALPGSRSSSPTPR